MCKRGEIYYVDFGEMPNSSKQAGIRPAVIVSNNAANTYSPVITVVPITSRVLKRRELPTHVFLQKNLRNDLSVNSLALAEQVCSIDKSQMRNWVGSIEGTREMQKLTAALQIQIGAAGWN